MGRHAQVTTPGTGLRPAQASGLGTFVLTSGRSGSTLLARLLHQHPDLVVVSDLIEPAFEEYYFDRHLVLDGDEFWALLSRRAAIERVEYWRRRRTDELLYLPDADDDVSLLMAYTLPFLADDPWRLRGELQAAVSGWQRRSAPEHFVAVLEFLRDRFDGVTWVERTGGSLPHAPAIIAAWPDARFVALHRDPVETAISMSTGSFFRLCLANEAGRPNDWLDPQFADPVALASMLDRWSVAAEAAIGTVPAERVFRLTFERLTDEPAEALTDIVEFVLERPATADDVAWARKSGAMVQAPRRVASGLATSARTAIAQACAATGDVWSGLRHVGR